MRGIRVWGSLAGLGGGATGKMRVQPPFPRSLQRYMEHKLGHAQGEALCLVPLERGASASARLDAAFIR